MKKPLHSKTKLGLAFAMAAGVTTMTGCSSLPMTQQLGVLNNHDVTQTEDTCTMTPAQVQNIANGIKIGTPQQDVYKALKINDPQSLNILSSSTVGRVLYGGASIYVPFKERQQAQKFYSSLEGLSLHCRNITTGRSFGLTSTQFRTHGKDFTITMVFKKNAKPTGQNKLYSSVQIISRNANTVNHEGYLNGLNVNGKLSALANGAL